MPRKQFETTIDLEPIPYKSPDVACSANRKPMVYYKDSPYKRFRDAMKDICPLLTPSKWRKFEGAIKVYMEIRKPKAKTSKRDYPQGDVDNYAKGINDRLNDVIWEDDDQITDLRIVKKWATKQKPPGIYIKVVSL